MFIESAAIAIVYFIVKFLEMRFITGETSPLKVIIRDTAIVYLASVIGMYTLTQFKQTDILKGGGGSGSGNAPVGAFTADPDF